MSRFLFDPLSLTEDQVKVGWRRAWQQLDGLPGKRTDDGFYVSDGLLFCQFAYSDPHMGETEAYWDWDDGWCCGYTGSQIVRKDEQ